MHKFKKKIYSYLYIFFLICVFFFNEFSTKISEAKNFNITQIKIEESYDINFNKYSVIDKAFKKAFNILIFKILEKKDRFQLSDISIQEIKSLIESFSIIDEQFVNNNYIGQFEVQFNRKKILNLIERKSLISSSPIKIKALILPIILDIENNELFYSNENIFFNKWNESSKKYFLINYVMPNEDIEDYLIIKENINNLENYDFEEIIKKYSVNNYIILIMLKNGNQLNIFSKIKFDKDNMVLNRIENDINIRNFEDVDKLVNILKEDYEDKWKSINKVNTSIILPVRFSLNSNDYKLSKEFEQILIEVDYISNFKIEKFDNKEIIYKVIFNNSPDKFLKKMLLLNIKIDTSKDVWAVK